MKSSLRLAALSVVGLVGLAGATGCTPMVKYRQLKPAKFVLAKEPSFVVGKVEVKPDTELSRKKKKGLGGALLDAATTEYKEWEGGKELRSELESAMRSAIAGHERAKYAATGASYRLDIKGGLSVRDDADESEKAIKEKGKVVGKKKVVKITRRYELDLRYELYSAADGALIGASAHKRTKSESVEGDNADDARGRLKDWEDTGKKLITSVIPDVMKEILPYYQSVQRELMEGKGKACTGAAERAQRGDFEGAATTWKSLLEQPDGLGKEDKLAALHNLGLYYESRDELPNAQTSYNGCLEERLCRQGLERVKAREAELARLAASPGL